MWVTVHEAGKLEHPAQPAGSSAGWSYSFQGAQESLLAILNAYVCLGREGSGKFQGLPDAFESFAS